MESLFVQEFVLLFLFDFDFMVIDYCKDSNTGIVIYEDASNKKVLENEQAIYRHRDDKTWTETRNWSNFYD